MRFAPLLGAAALLAAAAWPEALAQEGTPVQPGQRVRVRSTVASTPELTGVVEAVRPDTLMVRDDDRSMATAIPLAGIARLQVSRGRHSKFVTGMMIGGGVGAAAGAIIGLATHDESGLFTPGGDALLGALVLTPVGALTGAIIGAFVKTERWETVPLGAVAPQVSWGRDGRLSLGVRIAL